MGRTIIKGDFKKELVSYDTEHNLIVKGGKQPLTKEERFELAKLLLEDIDVYER